MKLIKDRSSEEPSDDAKKPWPKHLFGGQFRTSTLVLIAVFLAVWWTYETYRPHPEARTNTPPPAQVVPPGYLPDPDYTWVPKTRVNQTPVRTTPVPTTTTPTPSPLPTTTTTTPPPFAPPTLPCLVPALCPPSSSVTPPPGPGSTPSSTPPGR